MADSEEKTTDGHERPTAAEALSARTYQVASGSYGVVEQSTVTGGFSTPRKGPVEQMQVIEQHSHHGDLRLDRVWMGNTATILPKGITLLYAQTEIGPSERFPNESEVGWSTAEDATTVVVVAQYDHHVRQITTGFYSGLMIELGSPDDHGWAMLASCKSEAVRQCMTQYPGMNEASATAYILRNALEYAPVILDAAMQLQRGPFSFDEPSTA